MSERRETNKGKNTIQWEGGQLPKLFDLLFISEVVGIAYNFYKEWVKSMDMLEKGS